MFTKLGGLSLEPKSVPPPKRTGWIGRGNCHMEKATIDLKRDGKDLSGRVHQLPCCVKHDGPASVSHYFKPKHKGVGEDEGLPLQEAHFRGRLLQGTTLPLPHGYSGTLFLSQHTHVSECFLFLCICVCLQVLSWVRVRLPPPTKTLTLGTPKQRFRTSRIGTMTTPLPKNVI